MSMTRYPLFFARLLVVAALVATRCVVAGAVPNVAFATLPASATGGQVTVFYPTVAAEVAVHRGPFTLALAADAEPALGNRRLVVVSHGSGGSPWVHADLARALVQSGFVVAMPWHRGDNMLDDRHPGPDSWALRPTELSQAIDAVGQYSRLAPLLDLDRVGVYGMSAGGHAALSMAGGRWSRAGFKRHCDAHLADDFNACVGLITSLAGNAFDALRLTLARWVIDWRFADDTPQAHHDPRVAAVAAAVPFAADFDMASLVDPPVPLALFTSSADRWLTPRFHSGAVLAACVPCEHPVDFSRGGHGAWLSPMPRGLVGREGDLLNDPPGFDRSGLPAANQAVVAFFLRHLREAAAGTRR